MKLFNKNMDALSKKIQTIKNRTDFETSITKITHWQELIDQEEEKIFDYLNQNPEGLMDE